MIFRFLRLSLKQSFNKIVSDFEWGFWFLFHYISLLDIILPVHDTIHLMINKCCENIEKMLVVVNPY